MKSSGDREGMAKLSKEINDAINQSDPQTLQSHKTLLLHQSHSVISKSCWLINRAMIRNPGEDYETLLRRTPSHRMAGRVFEESSGKRKIWIIKRKEEGLNSGGLE